MVERRPKEKPDLVTVDKRKRHINFVSVLTKYFYLKRNPDLGLNISSFLDLYLFLDGLFPGTVWPRWMVIWASWPLGQSFSTWTTSLWLIGRTETPLISIRMSPSCRVWNLRWNEEISNKQAISFLHLSKHPSDLKPNGRQEKTPFSGTVFQTLSQGVLRFVASVSFKNHWIKPLIGCQRISISQKVVFLS